MLDLPVIVHGVLSNRFTGRFVYIRQFCRCIKYLKKE